MITDRVRAVLREALAGVCSDFDVDLLEFGCEDDHVHLLVAYPPKVQLSKLINSLKGVSAYAVRKMDLPEVRAKLWDRHFWSPSYCAVSCGGTPLETIKQYIADQRQPPRKQGEKRLALTPP